MNKPNFDLKDLYPKNIVEENLYPYLCKVVYTQNETPCGTWYHGVWIPPIKIGE